MIGFKQGRVKAALKNDAAQMARYQPVAGGP